MYTVKEVGYSGWNNYFERCQKVNMLQCWQYGEAKEQTSSWKAIRFLISDDEGKAIAIAQFLSKTLPILGGVARMNRGPLLLNDVDFLHSEKQISNVIAALIRESKRRRWWLIQVAPEIIDSDKSNQYLENLGLKKMAIVPWASGLLSLESDENILMEGLKGKWRNCLRKGLKLCISITIKECDSTELTLLLKRYHQLQNDKGFSGLPNNFISALAAQTGDKWQFVLYIANDESRPALDECIGMLVSVRHGDTATYMIGSIDGTGRKLQANYVLLWNAILHSKKIGCKWFDIGGLNSATPKGISHFKQGLNSELYSLIGEWRGYVFPWNGI